jgi:hypothetical protein
MNGDISRVAAEDLLRQTTAAQNNNTKYLQETVKAVGKLRNDVAKGKVASSAVDEDSSFILGRLEQKVNDLTAAVETLVREQRTSNKINEKVVTALTKLVGESSTAGQLKPEAEQNKEQKNDFGMVV